MSNTQFTHCDHGASYKDECQECEKVWAEHVQIPAFRSLVARLLRFYSVDSLLELIKMQSQHVDKLQAKAHRPADDQQAFVRVREG